MMVKARFIVVFVLFVAWRASSQDLGIKAPAVERTAWIINATIHPVSGPVIENGSLEITREGKIGQIISGTPHIPAPNAGRPELDWNIVRAKGKHVYPGLIGANTLTGLMEIGAVRATVDYAETGAITPEVRAAVAVNPDSTIIPVTRANGVLTVGVMPMGGVIPGRASVMNLDGWTWEDMAVDAEAGVVVNWPNMRPARGWFVTRTLEEQEKERREALASIDQAFASAQAYLKGKAADGALATDTRWEAMRGVIEKQKPVFIRADELEQIQSAVAWAVHRGVKPVILGGRDAGACLDLLKRHDVGVIVAGTHRMPKRLDSDYDEAYRLPVALQEAGVRWCLATTGGAHETPHERNLPYHAAMAVAHGLDHDAALRSITLGAAEMLGVAERLGSLEQGKDATLIITDGDPLEVTTKIEHAFIRGREIDLSNKQTALEKKYREKYRQLGVKRD